MDTTNIMMAPLPYSGRNGPRMNPLLTNFLLFMDTYVDSKHQPKKQ